MSDKKKPEELSLEELKKKLEGYQKQKDEYLAGWQRARADFINYKKEETERVGTFFSYAIEGLVLKFLPILDNFELIEKNLPKDLDDNEYIKGVSQIKVQVKDILKNLGVKEIKALKEKFDPSFHEAVEQVETEGEESGIVIEEVQKGYKLQDKVIRPAKVKVAK